MFLSATVKAMEAIVAERGSEMTEWSDGRLDELSTRMDNGFARIDKQLEQVHEDIQGIHVRFDGLQRTLLQMNAVIVAALIGLIATQI
jgi:hypothetical protein